MFPEFGHFALILALCLALIQASLPLLGAIKNKPSLIALAKPAAFGQLFFLSLSIGCLMYAFASNDFSVRYVAENSNSHLPLLYRLAAVWGAHEGSLLLWVVILGAWTGAVAFFSRNLPEAATAQILAVLGMISVGFLLFLLTTSNPFARLLITIPVDGNDLNPLLQDPGLAIHPPILYMGYVGFAVVFAFAITALMNGRLDSNWTRWARPWTLAAWCFLTLGITLGSWWAYRVLGWGGWWFWDPVENASFLPWLVGTALIHSLAVTEKRGAFKGWTLLLAICAFALSLMGTFLVRSGILTSVHAFANDPTRGIFMLKFLFLVIGSSLLLYAWRAPKIYSNNQPFAVISKETLLLSNNAILLVCMATILLGTLYPLLLDALDLGKISVGSPYFNSIFVPLFGLLVIFMGIGPQCQWQQTDSRKLSQQLRYALLSSIGLAVMLPFIFASEFKLSAAIGLALASWIILTLVFGTYRRLKLYPTLRQGMWQLSMHYYGMIFAHLGIAVCVIGIALTTAYHVERDLQMGMGESVTVGPYAFRFEGVQNLRGPNYTGTSGQFSVSQQGKEVNKLQAQKRLYNVQQTMMTEAAIDVGLWRDLYIALGEPLADGAWAVRIYYKPFVRWIWLGGLLMMFGGILAALDRRYRHKGVQDAKALINHPRLE